MSQTIPLPSNPEELLSILKKYSISVDGWKKDVKCLYNELVEGECVLQTHPDHGLIRKVNVIRVECYAKNDTLKLIEDKQIYHKRNEVVKRGFECVCEKAKSDEEPIQTAKRGLEEELQLNTSLLTINQIPCDEKKMEKSPCYISLMCLFIYYDFKTSIPDDQFKEEYLEVQEDKTTYFVWKSQ